MRLQAAEGRTGVGTTAARRAVCTALYVICASVVVTGLQGVGQSAAASPVPGTQPLSCVPLIGTRQLIPPLPGVIGPIPGPGGPSAFDGLAPAPADVPLPAEVDLRDNSQGFNSYVDIVLRDGSLFTRPRGAHAGWRKVATPGCLEGNVVSMSLDNNLLVALDKNGWIYSLDNVLSAPASWNWSRLFGAPIWLWPGMTVPADPTAQNKWSLTDRMSTSFTDAEGHTHPVVDGLVEVVSLTGDGSRIVYQDPWLPPDHSYEIGGPEEGRFQADSISTSGSVTFVMNRFGDMYTRDYDFDLSGANLIAQRYTWQEQGPMPAAPSQLQERVDPRYAAVSLPAQPWRHQPKVPGEITSRISISDTGPDLDDRELRVEGRHDGRSGYWHKGLDAVSWEFTGTEQPLARAILEAADPAVDQSALTLAPQSDLSFEGALPGGWKIATTHFDWAQSTHPVTLTSPEDRTYRVQMYTADGLRLLPRGPGLDSNPRVLDGALDVRGAAPWLPENADLGRFVKDQLDGKQIYEVTVGATREQLTISRAGLVPRTLTVLARTPAGR